MGGFLVPILSKTEVMSRISLVKKPCPGAIFNKGEKHETQQNKISKYIYI